LVDSSAKNFNEILLVDAVFIFKSSDTAEESVKLLVRNFIFKSECLPAPVFEVDKRARWLTF
jgi:hypothetical protein